ncbi:MAG: radical SAM protein [Cyanobacteriota bacterium]
MKTLLLFPPQWTPFSPPLSVPVLTAYLRANNIEVIQRDANIEFYNYILSKDFISGVKNKVDTFMDRCNKLLGASGNLYVLPEKAQIKYKVIQQLFKELEPWWPELETNTERAIKILKTPDMFYQPLLLAEAIFHLKYALQACGLAYFPSELHFNFYQHVNYKLSIESIKEAADDEESNIFLEYYNNTLLKDIIEINPDFVGISIGCNTQLIGGLTLARKIKALLPHAHVNIGGNSFTRLLDIVDERPEIFDYFTDSITYGEGEIALLTLVQALEKNEGISNVPSIAYKKDNKTIINSSRTPYNLNNLPTPDFDGLDLSLYLGGDIIFPVQSSRGCYWQKCTFCDHDFGNKYAIKTPSKMVKELKELSEKYNTKYFYFVDEAISPNYMKSLAKTINETKLDIAWYTCARAEIGFDKETCETSSKAGLKMLLWGLESGSDRILDLINKGIKKDAYLETLKNTADAGVWNHAFFFFGFPSEELLEAMESINVLIKNKKIIHSYGMGPFTLGKYSPIAEHPEKYFISNIEPYDEELATATDRFTTTQGMSREDVNNFVVYNTEYCAEQYGYPLWMSIGGYKDHIFLYVTKYGQRVPAYTPDETVQAFGSF